MLVIVSVRRLDNDRIEIGVARPQHHSNPTQNYAFHLNLLAQMGANERLKFAPMDVPQNRLLARRFQLDS
jgi:hypothetical protein